MGLEEMPPIVLTVTIAMIVFGTGIFAFYVTVDELGTYGDLTEHFAVDNPQIDQTCSLEYDASAKPVVWQFNGFEWLLVNPTYVSYSGNDVIVSHNGLQG